MKKLLSVALGAILLLTAISAVSGATNTYCDDPIASHKWTVKLDSVQSTKSNIRFDFTIKSGCHIDVYMRGWTKLAGGHLSLYNESAQRYPEPMIGYLTMTVPNTGVLAEIRTLEGDEILYAIHARGGSILKW